jgi:hypothetical protein
MATSKAAVQRYKQKAYDRILLLLPKGQRDEVKAMAAKCGLSVNKFLLQLIEEYKESADE